MPGRQVCAAIIMAVAVAGVCPEAAAQDTTSGALQGVARDAADGEPLAGVLVVAAFGGREQVVMTDERGRFKITDLAPGSYQVVFQFAEVTSRYTGVRITIGHVTALHPKIDLSRAGVTYEFDGRAPVLDATKSDKGFVIGREMLDKGIHLGIDAAGTLGVIPGTAGDPAGISFSGSSSPESRISIDGMDTTGIKYGTFGATPLIDFVEEIDVVTGGYNAEHGRSTGAVINVVTKSGTNQVSGSAWTRLTPGVLVAPRRVTPSEGSAIDAEANLAYDMDFGVEVGGPLVRDRLWYYIGFAPQLGRTDIDRVVKRQTDCRQVSADGALSDCDPGAYGDGIADVDPDTGFRIFEEVERRRLASTVNRYPFLGKLNWAPRREHQGQLSLVATPVTGESVGVFGAPGAVDVDYHQLTTDLAAKWTSKLHDNRTEISAVVGWHRVAANADSTDDALNDTPRQNYRGLGIGTLAGLGLESETVRAGCADSAGDPYPYIENCPVENAYGVGGPGSLVDETAERRSLRVDLTRRMKHAGGSHELKAGADVEDNRLDHLRKISGGAVYDHIGSSVYANRWVELGAPDEAGFDQMCGSSGLGSDDQDALPCRFLAQDRVLGRTFNWAAYLRDSWQPVPNLTVNLGLRYEEQRLRYAEKLQNTVDPYTGEELGTNAMKLDGMWAPRAGVAYDWTREGKSRLYAHWGRFYESIPLDINNRSFGGEVFYRQVYDLSQCAEGDNGLVDGTSCMGPSSSQTLFGSGVLVAPGVKAQYMDEALFGAEYELTSDLKVGASYQDRRLGRVLEDVSVDNAQTYILANPGEWSADAERALEDRIADTTDPDEAARLGAQLEQLRAIRDFDRPRRDYRALQLTAIRRFSRRFFAQASYTYSRTQGNFPGLVSADNGQLDPNISSQYDLIELLSNRDGPLPIDRPHYVKLDGYYTFDLSRYDFLTTAVRARALSGAPVSALGAHHLYGFNESFLLPRGAMGRTSFDWGLDLRINYQRTLTRGMRLEVWADLFNLFNRQGTASVSQTYTLDNANPVVGGDYRDLVFLKALDAGGGETTDPVARWRNFGNPTVRYAPLSARVGARLSF